MTCVLHWRNQTNALSECRSQGKAKQQRTSTSQIHSPPRSAHDNPIHSRSLSYSQRRALLTTAARRLTKGIIASVLCRSLTTPAVVAPETLRLSPTRLLASPITGRDRTRFVSSTSIAHAAVRLFYMILSLSCACVKQTPSYCITLQTGSKVETLHILTDLLSMTSPTTRSPAPTHSHQSIRVSYSRALVLLCPRACWISPTRARFSLSSPVRSTVR